MVRDVIIVGAGVVGCAIARELSRWDLDILVVDQASDVAEGGCTKANTAIVHGGYDAKEGTLKAKYNVEGNGMFDKLCAELEVPFERNGSLVVAFEGDDLSQLEVLRKRGETNGVPGLKVLSEAELREKEPHVGSTARGALWVPTGAIVCPYELTIALAENAVENGAHFQLDTAVTGIRREGEVWLVETAAGETLEAKAVVNAAGYQSGKFNNMVTAEKLDILPRRGEYYMIDKSYAGVFHSAMFQLPSDKGKGILVARTVDGSILIGPTAEDVDDPTDTRTTAEGLDKALTFARKTWEDMPTRSFITTFAGVRPRPSTGDFKIGEPADAPFFFNAAGIESPGLTSAPAIGKDLAQRIAQRLNAGKKDNFNPNRKAIPKFRELSNEERAALIAQDPAFGRIVCRCETVTEGEIRAAIRRPLGARTLDGVKRRTRAGMGRCQSGFCSPRVVAILCEELGMDPTEVTKFGGNSKLLVGRIGEEGKA